MSRMSSLKEHGRRALARVVRTINDRSLTAVHDTSARFTARYPTVEVFEWRPSGGAINFGDHLAKVIVARMLSTAGRTELEEVTASRRLFCVGSVLHFARDGDVVWGSGVNGKVPEGEHEFTSLDVRSVRGPLTAEFLRQRGIDVPAVYGDPALLLPVLFEGRFKHEPRSKAALVLNLHDLDRVQTSLPIISPLQGWNRVVEQILSAELVISSSLHGLVIAEAYGVPARYVRLSEHENLFKYEDYVRGTGRDELQYASSIDEALRLGGMPPATTDAERLMDAFPWDLWR